MNHHAFRTKQHAYWNYIGKKINQEHDQSIYNASDSDLHPHILLHGTSVNLFCHQTTRLTYQATEMTTRALLGMAELQLQCSGKASHVAMWLLPRIWLWSPRLRTTSSGKPLKGFFSAATSAGWFSFPSKTLEGLFHNTHSRQATLLLSHSNYSLFIHSPCMFCKIIFKDRLNGERK